MTKKAERAARIAADKRNAYVKKVRLLIGHVRERLPAEYVNAAYDSGKTADEFAAEIAAREPVGKAVHPLKTSAIKEAHAAALAAVDVIAQELETVSWDIDKIAPHPNAMKMGRDQYHKAQNRRARFQRVTKSIGDGTRRPGEADIRKLDKLKISELIRAYEEQAALQYDMFIVKLVAKIGPCVSATLEGNHVWSHSILVVEKEEEVADGASSYPVKVIERWKTQQITNVSKLGLYFPQWPSRLMK
jgi:hypothetical protein